MSVYCLFQMCCVTIRSYRYSDMGVRSDERRFVGRWGTFVDLGVEWELQVRVCLGRKSVHQLCSCAC